MRLLFACAALTLMASISFSQTAQPTRPKVGILVFPGVQIIDYTGPYEVFGAGGYDAFIVGETLEPIQTAMGMTVIPKYTFDDCPQLEVLVIPGGGGSLPGAPGVGAQMTNQKLLNFVKGRSAEAKVVMSVCNGAFLAGEAGLLDEGTATTFAGGIDQLIERFPKAKVVRDQRFTDNGKIVTTAGLSSGIDGALHVIEKLKGLGAAQRTALAIEYDWRPDSGYARASLADLVMRPAIGQGFALPEGALWRIESDSGTRDQWEKLYTVGYEGITDAHLLEIVDNRLAATWKKASTKAIEGGRQTTWGFTDNQGRDWKGVSEVVLRDASAKIYKLSIRVSR